MKPLVSVIVPVYNMEKYLPNCIDSILRQSYQNIEIILIDDGSQDMSGRICDNYKKRDKRIRVLHKKNEGIAKTRNKGLEQCDGEYVTFIDSDDWVGKEYIANFMKYQPFDILYSGCTKVAFDEEKVQFSQSGLFHKNSMKSDLLYEMVTSSLFGYGCGKIYRKAIISEMEYEDILLREDLVFNLKAFSKATKIYISRNCDYYYRQHSASLLHNEYSGDIPDMLKTSEYILNLTPNVSEKSRRMLSNYMLKLYLTDIIAKCILRHSKINECAKKEYLKTVFNSKLIRSELRIYKSDSKLFKLFTVCYKLKFPNVYYQIMKRVV